MKIIVTGGSGFIGSSVVRHLIKKLNYYVINVDKLTYAGNLDSLEDIANRKNYVFEKTDITNKSEINRIFYQHQPDSIIHLAAESHVDRSIDSPSEFIKTNVVGTYTLLEEAKRYWLTLDKKKRKNFRFLHVSTDEVFGDLEDCESRIKENSSYAPSSPYSASKASSDHFVRAWNRTYSLPIIITNSSNNYGPFQFPEKLIPTIILNAINGKKLPIYGNGRNIRDWLYVDDHTNALVKVLLNGNDGETYNISAYSEKSNIDVANKVCSILDKKLPKHPPGIKSYKELITFVEDRPGHDKKYAMDSSKIVDELGWKPSNTFETGIKKTIKWYLANKWWWVKILKKVL